LTSSLPLDDLLSRVPTDFPGASAEPSGAPAAGGATHDARPLADPLAEARRLISCANDEGLTVRVLGGVAICLQAPGGKPLLPRPIKDIDLVTRRGEGRQAGELLAALGYVGEEMFNALHGSRRLLFHDPVNGRELDVFVGEFAMCHAIPVADRLDRDPLTVPLAELLLTKLQIVELTERDKRDVYNLCFHHELSDADDPGIETSLIAGLCASDWGLWRTCKGTIDHCRADMDRDDLEPGAREVIASRLQRLWDRIEAAPKTGRWRLRSRVGERKRWYQEPEEERHSA
jgi:hypothetical protein